MRYDFDSIVDRGNTQSLKWSIKENELPMWVADMDFKAAPEIREALMKRLEHGVFGYSDLTDEWYESYILWWKKYHNFNIEKEDLIFSTGVVPSISSIVRKLTTANENVVIQTPVYNIFFNSIINNGARVYESPLRYENGEYSIDFVDLEMKLKDPQSTLMILCNPHNPVGKIWDRETLAKIGKLCKKYGVTVVSDEIHCDITKPNCEYYPFLSIDETCQEVGISLIAPTKAFNIAGLQTSAVCVKNPFLRHKVWRALNTDEVAEPNAFAQTAAIAAFNNGKAWLDEMREYVFENRRIAGEFIKANIPQVQLVEAEATYLLWLDISKVSQNSDELESFIREETGLYVTSGAEYGESGRKFLRMNVACPKSVVLDGLERLKVGIEKFNKR